MKFEIFTRQTCVLELTLINAINAKIKRPQDLGVCETLELSPTLNTVLYEAGSKVFEEEGDPYINKVNLGFTLGSGILEN